MIIFSFVIVSTITFIGVYKVQSTWTENGDILANVEALAQGETPTTWFRKDEDCIYTFTGQRNRKVTIMIGGSVVATGNFDSDGKFVYEVKDGKTHCTAGGHEQCMARYCPVVISKIEPL